MWIIIDTKTKEKVFEVATYKQGLNFVKDQENRGHYQKDQLEIKVGK